jgi:DNA-binding ferritin-like protein
VITGVCVLLAAVTLSAQSRKDPLTDQQIEAVREAGDQPLERIKLFVGYVDDRAKEINSLSKDSSAQNRSARIRNLFDEFTRLCDELQDNMDNFDQQHADLRKALKTIVDKTAEWATVLDEPPPNGNYDFLRKTALDSNKTAHELATQMLDDEGKYFAEKKKEEKEEQKR